jgi:hypothetical protein
MPLSGDTLLLVYIGGAGLLVVLFLILLISMIRKSVRKKKEEAAAAELEARIEPPEPERVHPVEQPAPAAAHRIQQPVPEPLVPFRHPNGAHLWRDPATGRVMAEVDGIEFANSQDLTPEQRRKLVLVLKEVAAWIQDPAPKPAPAPAVQSKPITMASSAQPKPTPPPPPPRPVVVPDHLDPTAAVYAEPRKTGSLTSPGEKAAEVKKTAPFSIVTQIDAILQGMLVDSPLKAKGIRLVEDLKGGVTVWVGLQRYPGIDAVTDPEALAIIRAAVAEWERSSSS